MWKIQLFKLNFDYRETDAVASAIDSGWIAMGARVSSFEQSFSEYLGGEMECLATSSGTAALHLALLALGVGLKDEVIIPALTFVADANVVRMVGSRPILADCASLDHWNVSAESIGKVITEKTKAVIVVHYAGFPCDMVPIVELCRERGVALIEDVAHAPGALIDGQACGTFGDIACFSFFSNKNISLGEGGMVATKSSELMQMLRYLRSHGMSSLTLDRHKGRAISYDVACPGLNYRMDEMRAALGIVQLEKLPQANKRRKELFERYRVNLENSKVAIPFSDFSANWHSVYHILPVLLPIDCDRTTVIEKLKLEGIQSSIHYPPFWDFSGYEGWFSKYDTPITAEVCDRELTLPLFPTMTDDEVDLVTTTLKEVIA
jgi:dTDP-4-amino-4,6-dideoxygalactose transaminase